jgi:hypothetical protein
MLDCRTHAVKRNDAAAEPVATKGSLLRQHKPGQLAAPEALVVYRDRGHSGSGFTKMTPRSRYWTIHWLRVALWPLPVVTLFKAGRTALNAVRH